MGGDGRLFLELVAGNRYAVCLQSQDRDGARWGGQPDVVIPSHHGEAAAPPGPIDAFGPGRKRPGPLPFSLLLVVSR